MRKRSATASGDMSTPALGPYFVEREAHSSSRCATAFGVISTTVELPESLNVGDVLRPPSGKLHRYQAFTRYNVHLAIACLNQLSPIENRPETLTGFDEIKHERLRSDHFDDAVYGES